MLGIRGIGRAALLIAPCLLLAAAPRPARAAFAGPNGRLLVGPSGAAAFTINADGTDRSGVTGFADGGSGSLSADGTLEAYAPAGSGLVVRTLATGADVPIVTGVTVASPSLSPDGSEVAWQQGGTVLRAPSDGSGDPELVAAQGADEHFGRGIAWTPDGSEIVVGTSFRGCEGSCSSLQVVALAAAGGTRRPITALGTLVDDNEEQALAPDVAGDGSAVVFLEDVSPPTDPSFTSIAVAPLSGGSAQPLRSDGHGKLELPRFSPDGSSIAYLHSRADARLELRAFGSAGAADHLVDDASGAGYGSVDALQWLPGTCLDDDGDALCDAWERDGLDVDGDGAVDLDLPAMGAHPDHKDVFLEIDAMPAHALSAIAVDSVVDAFAAAPVGNPDGKTGITLHVDNGPVSVMDPVSGALWGSRSGHETLPHRDVLGTVTANEYDWAAFDVLKAAHFDDARRPVFHYAIGAHRYGAATEFSSGISRGIGAADLIVSLGSCRSPGAADCNFGDRIQAGTLMHELGHNLGLEHGGTDSLNYKPVYLSIMNYAFQFSWLVKQDKTRVLDYSRTTLAVDESALDEHHGYGALPGSTAASFKTFAKGCDGMDHAFALTDGPLVDFDCDTFITPTLVTADLNDDTRLSQLTGEPDWPLIVYSGGGIGFLGAPAPPAQTELIEPPVSELLADAAVLDGPVTPPPLPRPATLPPAGVPTVTPPRPQVPRCTLKPRSRTIGKRGRLRIAVRCDAAASLRLSVRLKLGRHRLAAKADNRRVRAGARVTLTVKLPKRALRGLARHRRVSAVVTLRASNAGGSRVTKTRISRLTRR